MAVVLTLPRISEAFLILRAVQLGVSNTAAPWVLVCLSLAYALVAYPAGRLSDRMPRMRMVALGMFVLVMANALLAGAHNFVQVLVGVALGGMHLRSEEHQSEIPSLIPISYAVLCLTKNNDN